MSFRGDSQRRYGHVPPVRYPVANQQAPAPPGHIQGQGQLPYPPTRLNTNGVGDNTSSYTTNLSTPTQSPPPATEDELFLASPTESGRASYHGASNHSAHSAMSGYQHQYTGNSGQAPSAPPSYNPQAFARTQSQSLPYHPHPNANANQPPNPNRYSSTSPTAGSSSYTPAPYNPAAYSGGSSALQRHSTYAGHAPSNQHYHYQQPHQQQQQQQQLAQSSYWPSQPNYAVSSGQALVLQSQSSLSPANYDQSHYDQVSPANSTYDLTHSQYPQQPSYANNTTSPAATPSSAPYPVYSQIPVGPNYSAGDPHAFATSRSSISSAHVSPIASPPIQSQASPGLQGLQRHPTNAPLPSRPVDRLTHGRSWESNGQYSDDYNSDFNSGHMSQEDMMHDIEAELSGVGGGSQRALPDPYPQRNGTMSISSDSVNNGADGLQRLTSRDSYRSTATTINMPDDDSGVNRYSSNASTLGREPPGDKHLDDGDESDPEATAGLMAMREAEEDDRRLSSAAPFSYYGQPELAMQPSALPDLAEEPSSDSDYAVAAMDMGMFSGGHPGNMAYGNGFGMPPQTDNGYEPAQARSSHASHPSQGSNQYPAFEQADVDYNGTGGLQAPQAQRLSFDGGDEHASLQHSDSESPYKDDIPDLFYHPGLSNRPLPAIPAGSDSSSILSAQSPHRTGSQAGYQQSALGQQQYTGPDAMYGQNAQQLQVERSISLSSHATTPQVQPPARSRTDAAEDRNNRLRQLRGQQVTPHHGPGYDSYDPTGTGSSMDYDAITLPSGRRKKFIPEKLTIMDTKSCVEPWALSGISQWLREMAEGEPDLRRKTVEDGLIRLFCIKTPTMNVADAEGLSSTVVDLMLKAGILVPDEEWLKFGPGSLTGVLCQLTGSGCYAPKLHEFDQEVSVHQVTDRCYSFHCGRTLKKANLDDLLSRGSVRVLDWASHYKLKKEDLDGKHKKEIERQNILHEIVTGEEEYIEQLDVLRVLYRDHLMRSQPRIISESRLVKFVELVFGKVDKVEQVNKNHLLAQLKYRQKEQGPWIVGFSEIFREWIRAAKAAYIEYATGFNYAQYLVRKEAERNYMFKQFLDQNQLNPRSKRLDWSTFLKAPITRLQRYSLLLQTSMKNMLVDSEEKINVARAIEEIKAVTTEADSKVAEMEKKVTMIELNNMLVLRPGYHADLNLDHLGRELIRQGELTRMGSKGVRWVDTQALLFDHYLILAKLVTTREKHDKIYDVSKEPIPMPLLFLESSQDEPVAKQKSIAAPLGRVDPKISKVASNDSRPGLEHTNTMNSMGGVTVTRLAPGGTAEDGKILYPFRIKHLGHEVYTLFASTAQIRDAWCDKIIEAKTRHAKALHAQNAEPFRLRVMSDSAFAYDTISGVGKYVSGVHIRGTPLDRAIRDVEQHFGTGRGPSPISRSAVNCATSFWAFGKNMVAVGTDAGVFVAEAGDTRGWQKTASIARVTQLAVLEDFSSVLVLADKNLISYPLDVISPPANFPAPTGDNPRRSPQKLAKDVAFFATARMKDRMLVFYKRKEGLHSTFKVLEPVYQKSTERKTRLFSSRRGAGATDSFRDYDDFYLPVECYSINLFHTYMAIATSKGFELMTLDKKVPLSIPDVKQPAIANIASRIRDQRPLGMFRLNDQEFLLAYEDCAVYVDKHGDVSRSVIMEYSGKQKKAKGATMYGQYLLLFNEDYVEVRNAENGRLRQIIAGRDVRVLDYGIRGPTGGLYHDGKGIPTIMSENAGDGRGTVKICMAHPEVPNQQVVLELLLNNGHAEK